MIHRAMSARRGTSLVVAGSLDLFGTRGGAACAYPGMGWGRAGPGRVFRSNLFASCMISIAHL